MLFNHYFLLWKRWDYRIKLSANLEQIKELKKYKDRGLAFQSDVNQAIKQTGIVQNTHLPHSDTNPRHKVSKQQRDVVAWSITAKEGHFAGQRPVKKPRPRPNPYKSRLLNKLG